VMVVYILNYCFYLPRVLTWSTWLFQQNYKNTNKKEIITIVLLLIIIWYYVSFDYKTICFINVCNHNSRSINYYFYFGLLLLIIEHDYDDYYSHWW
jgi:type II secretory pathway component PulC